MVDLRDVPPEILLYIFSFLDIPDLETMARLSPLYAALASDPLLQRTRLLVIAPARVDHSLFGEGPTGVMLRPTVSDLVNRGVLRGLNIERRWRMGLYFGSQASVRQYETSIVLARRHASNKLTSQLRRRSIASPSGDRAAYCKSFPKAFPDAESSSPAISRSLLPIMHQLKWSLHRDSLAKVVRGGRVDASSFGDWLERRGRAVVTETERVRLAICPDIRRLVGFYESLAR
ncbi:uncharacterized protein SCHCODRAFT_02486154 [Schizophyllum commune H4-8]|uniref:F-box domain-containing protein n=1 Tax=Schizophyllum commune (strain H4-8 / FGSC 9210) TaxID=578458 RepID=D8PRE1_SCHCM|nr:uncharacterized protein SCHCODRAFT_02486154 [Schizophyllum commune H4-8]KAI5897989.1 hypothetical protein SCHCODRAFT_02486154 [Schizophyllum commune H4-8]